MDCRFTARVIDADTAAQRLWVASELVDGPTLDVRVDQAGPLPPQQAVALALGLAQALAAIHGRGLTHRDLKPSNIVLAADGPKVIDFGVAHLLEASSLTHTGALLGTLAWMAPRAGHRRCRRAGRRRLAEGPGGGGALGRRSRRRRTFAGSRGRWP